MRHLDGVYDFQARIGILYYGPEFTLVLEVNSNNLMISVISQSLAGVMTSPSQTSGIWFFITRIALDLTFITCLGCYLAPIVFFYGHEKLLTACGGHLGDTGWPDDTSN